MKRLIFLLLILLLVACKPVIKETNNGESTYESQYTCVNKFVDCYIGINKCKELCNVDYEKTEKESADKQGLIDCKNKCISSECDRLEKECIRELS